jgi:N-acetylmuramoyl-L-alanine amidase
VIFLYRKIIVVSLVIINIFILAGISNIKENKEIEEALSRYGSTGNEVIQIQTKLKRWGYYSGAVDGIYGSQTLAAVRYFQSKNGLSVDGIAGPNTLRAMGITSSTSGTNNYESNVNLLARLIHGEARGEPYNGKVAVGAVVMNRVRDSRFPNTISGVIYEPGAFDAVRDGQINITPGQDEYNAARDAINGWDPSLRCYILF